MIAGTRSLQMMKRAQKIDRQMYLKLPSFIYVVATMHLKVVNGQYFKEHYTRSNFTEIHKAKVEFNSLTQNEATTKSNKPSSSCVDFEIN